MSQPADNLAEYEGELDSHALCGSEGCHAYATHRLRHIPCNWGALTCLKHAITFTGQIPYLRQRLLKRTAPAPRCSNCHREITYDGDFKVEQL